METVPSNTVADLAGGNWWPVTAMAFGIALILVGVVPSLTGAPDPYAAVALVAVGMIVIGIAVSIAVHDLVRGSVTGWQRAAVAMAAGAPVFVPMVAPIATLPLVTLYVFAVGLLTFLVRRSLASGFLLLLTSMGPAWLLLQPRLAEFAGGFGI